VAGSRYLALRKLARVQGRTTAELLQLYALEGFLVRLPKSPHRDRLILKGGMLLAAFDLRRPTRDLDFLALRTDNDELAVRQLVLDVASVDHDDGLVFHLDTLTSSIIRDQDVYPGIRVRLRAGLATANLILQADVNVGDPVVPGPRATTVPTLLETEPLEILGYPPEMVIAEKLVTALQRGRASTRWRDFADLLLLLQGEGLDDAAAATAIQVVAEYRQTPVRPLGEALHGMPGVAQERWSAWRRQHDITNRVPEQFGDLLTALDRRTRKWLGGEGPSGTVRR